MMKTTLRTIWTALQLARLAAASVLATELVYAHAVLDSPVRLEASIVGLYAAVFGAMGLGAGLASAVLRRPGAASLLVGAGMTLLVLALRLHDLADLWTASATIDGGLVLFTAAGPAGRGPRRAVPLRRGCDRPADGRSRRRATHHLDHDRHAARRPHVGVRLSGAHHPAPRGVRAHGDRLHGVRVAGAEHLAVGAEPAERSHPLSARRRDRDPQAERGPHPAAGDPAAPGLRDDRREREPVGERPLRHEPGLRRVPPLQHRRRAHAVRLHEARDAARPVGRLPPARLPAVVRLRPLRHAGGRGGRHAARAPEPGAPLPLPAAGRSARAVPGPAPLRRGWWRRFHPRRLPELLGPQDRGAPRAAATPRPGGTLRRP